MKDTKWKLKRTRQCAKCPWKIGVNRHEIPDGYSEDKHRALECTIAKNGNLQHLASGEMRIMACHETDDAHCIGWLANQLDRGNNIPLRIQMMSCGNLAELTLDGAQHETFAETLQ